MRFYFYQALSNFVKERINLFCWNTFVLAKSFQRDWGTHFYPPTFPFPFPKTEKEKGFQKEKIKKKGTKNRKNFLRIFPVAPLPLFQKRKEFRKRRGKIPPLSHSNLPSKAGRDNEKRAKLIIKRKKRNKKKGKRGEKEGFSRFRFLFPFPKKNERKEEKRKKKRKRKKKNGRKYVSSQGCGKQKDLVHPEMNKV